MKSFKAGINDQGVRLSRFCEKVCPTLPKSMLYKSFRNKRIKVNGVKQDADYRIQLNDELQLYINDEFFVKENTPAFTCNKKLDNILFEDENLLITYKPQGLLCHADNKAEDNLIDQIKCYLQEKGTFSPDKENTFTPSLCNRIDQGTDGLVIAAKNYKALVDMNDIIKQNSLDKQYLCVVQHTEIDGVFKAYHSRDKESKKVLVAQKPHPQSKEIQTAFKTLESKKGFSLIECTLITGRTHQIRAHLAFLQAPIVGDRKYGIKNNLIKSQLLSAYKIHFRAIPSQNSLAYLSGKTFTLQQNCAADFFNQL